MSNLFLFVVVVITSGCASFSVIDFPGHAAFIQAARLPLAF